ncbi:tyrosine-protein phosphatase [Thiosulfativibrio zosterae]|uniref:protein-tyrosine-phosphatase n=1 Tax=Thiosulfativibrio zosterae TaxID=2675053 RepID=A0A6F8PQU7_9GAMM|nr:CpsB/CapC family capsule biosynthesis tyrosine phosphatase [Thiosulfativibrio zosterae]BBP44485.1 tyrosine protein phosphatase [Thiosulfativibrio zosterae]
MYDLHNHLLPGIDDGSPDINTSLELAKIAISQGITHMVCTPHIHPGRYDNTLASIATALNSFKEALVQHNLNLIVSAAAEVRIGPEILSAIKLNTLPFLGTWNNQQVLLIEFPSNMIPIGSEKLTQWLIAQNIIPMIAHPERNQAIIDNPNRLRTFLDQGCLTQITAGAITGNFGQKPQKTAEILLLEDKVTILATDAHNLSYRPPVIQESLQKVTQLIGETRAKKLVLDNPMEIAINKWH